jgi:effector-binding domain-containing protein
MALEQPRYELVRKLGNLELRKYELFWIAECFISNAKDLSSASSYAFSRLFGYIQGRNSKAMPIQMTKPVRQEPHEGGWKISFVIPEDVRRGGIPEANDSGITIREVPGGLFAAIVYRGSWAESKQQAQTQKLMELISAEGLKPVGQIIGAVYNPPFTPGPLRHNEVMVAVTQ